MFTNEHEEHDMKREAKEIARKTVQMDDWERYVEGAAYRILKLEKQVQRLTFNFWLFFFFVFVLPIFFRVGG